MNVADLIKNREGLRLRPYRCTAGYLTVGYGRNLDSVGISEHEAEAMLHVDINAASRWLAERLPWTAELDPARYAALVDLRFNLGGEGLLSFKRFLAAAEL